MNYYQNKLIKALETNSDMLLQIKNEIMYLFGHIVYRDMLRKGMAYMRLKYNTYIIPQPHYTQSHRSNKDYFGIQDKYYLKK